MSLDDLIANQLPMNRKERFFTGTVFPMIVCADGFEHFERLTDLVPGCPKLDIKAEPDGANIEFFTEYGLMESRYGPAAQRLPQPVESRDTPDILVLVTGEPTTLLAFEAKMYDRPTREAVELQMSQQRTVVLDYIQRHLAVPRVFHAALLPQGLLEEFGGFAYPVVTWEALLEAFSKDREEDYWLRMLEIALDAWPSLVGPGVAAYGKKADDQRTGLDIYRRFTEGTLDFTLMGRHEGLTGEPLDEDLKSGRWKKQLYEVRREGPPPNRNWFPVAYFVDLVTKYTPSDAQTRI